VALPVVAVVTPPFPLLVAVLVPLVVVLVLPELVVVVPLEVPHETVSLKHGKFEHDALQLIKVSQNNV
jgi:hypothetical protein